MIASNIDWPKVKLSTQRLSNNLHEVFRDGVSVGRVRRDASGWHALGFIYPRGRGVPKPSWRCAVLHVARGCDLGVHNVYSYGPCEVTRVQADTVWYTVVTDKSGQMYLFRDFDDVLGTPSPALAVRLRRVFAAAAGCDD